VFGENVEHLFWFKVLESRPAKIFVRTLPRVLALRKRSTLHRFVSAVGFVLFQRMQVIESLDEEQICDLLHYFQRIGNAPSPKRVPYLVNFASYLACYQVLALQILHRESVLFSFRKFEQSSKNHTIGVEPCVDRRLDESRRREGRNEREYKHNHLLVREYGDWYRRFPERLKTSVKPIDATLTSKSNPSLAIACSQ